MLGTAVTKLPFHSDQLGRQADVCLVKALKFETHIIAGSLAPPSVDGSPTFHAACGIPLFLSSTFNHRVVVGGWERKEN